MVAKSGTQNGVAWRLAPSLVALVDETDRLWPQRSRISDGSIGDAAHAARESDHNPHDGWVTALDLTEDHDHGPSLAALWNHLVATRDRRVKYLIYEGRIVRSYPRRSAPAWMSSEYTGPNQHTRHLHASVDELQGTGPWYPGAGGGPKPKIPARPYPGIIRPGDGLPPDPPHPAVRAWQQAFAERGYSLAVDGRFGPATNHVVRHWQSRHALQADGIAGPATWHSVLFA